MLYFSYGSNMSHRRLLARVPSAEFVTVAELAAHDLRFHKIGRDGSSKCDAFHTASANDRVLGVVFNISPDEKAYLDQVEGVGNGYEQKLVSVNTPEKGPYRVFTYYATAIDATLNPYHWYKDHVVRGCIENALPGDYLEKVRSTISVEDRDMARTKQEQALYL
jgi:hypothetical protein